LLSIGVCTIGLVDNSSTAFSVKKNDDELSLVKHINKNIGNIWQYMAIWSFGKLGVSSGLYLVVSVPSKQQGKTPNCSLQLDRKGSQQLQQLQGVPFSTEA